MPQAWDEECDVLVVGSGAGGMMGAYTAGREGLAVILVESTDRFGGTSAYSGGGLFLPCNAALRRAGDDDTMEQARTYFRSVVGGRTPRDLQDAYLDTGAPMLDYLEQDAHFEFVIFPWPDYYGLAPEARAGGRHIAPMPLAAAALGPLKTRLRPALAEERRGHPAPDELMAGQALIGRFLLALEDRANVDMRLNARLTKLVREGDRVTGAVVEVAGVRRRIGARYGVLIAAGGFERNAEMRRHYGVPYEVSGAMGPPGNDGAPIAAGIAIGAKTDLMDQAWWSPGLLHPDGTATFTLGFDGGIFVADDGKRFANESSAYDRFGREIIAAVESGRVTLPVWLVYDDRDGGAPPIQYPNVPLLDRQAYVDAGLWRSAPTLAGLAEAIGVPPDALAATVARFNMLAHSGIDEDFGRGEEPFDRLFTGDRSPLVPILAPPFHAVAFAVSDLGTKGGLVTDRQARVQDETGPHDRGALCRRQLDGGGDRDGLSRRRQSDRRQHGVRLSRRARHGRPRGGGARARSRPGGCRMTKIVTLFLRRADLTRAQFRQHYEVRHVPMNLAANRYFGFHKYVRNHVVGAEPGLLPLPEFDAFTEFSFRDLSKAVDAQAFMATPDGKALADDELNFLDMGYHPILLGGRNPRRRGGARRRSGRGAQEGAGAQAR